MHHTTNFHQFLTQMTSPALALNTKPLQTLPKLQTQLDMVDKAKDEFQRSTSGQKWEETIRFKILTQVDSANKTLQPAFNCLHVKTANLQFNLNASSDMTEVDTPQTISEGLRSLDIPNF